MREIVLTEEQSRVLSGPPRPVVIKDQSGRVVGELDPLPNPEWIAEMKRRAASPGPWYTGAAIRAMFDALEAERERIGPFSVEYMDQFVKRLEESDPAKYGPEAPVNYTVKWETDVRKELHYLWVSAPDPAAVRSASETAERLLAIDPFGTGRHLSEGLWRYDVPPLVVHYEIDQDARMVKITDVQQPE